MSPLPSPLSNTSENTNWRDLYRAAIREVDPSKLAKRIAEAGCAMIARANDLLQDGSNNREEAEDLNDALHALRALSNNLKFSTSALTAEEQRLHLARRERLEQIKREMAELRKGNRATPSRRGYSYRSR